MPLANRHPFRSTTPLHVGPFDLTHLFGGGGLAVGPVVALGWRGSTAPGWCPSCGCWDWVFWSGCWEGPQPGDRSGDQVGPLPALGEAQAESSAAFDELARDVGAVLSAESHEGPFSQLGHILDRMTV